METIDRKLSRDIRKPFNRIGAFRQLKKFHASSKTLEEIVDNSIRFPSTGYFRVDSIQKRSEILALASMVEKIQPNTIVEIGTARGGTLFLWSQLAKKLVISCDLNEPKEKQAFYHAFPPPGSNCKVVNLKGDSHEPQFKARVEQELNGEKVDFLFIDGDHTELGVEADYRDYHSLVRPGGLIAFHDILEKQPVPTNQVYHFWKRIKENQIVEEFIDDAGQTGFGIGVIKVPD